MHLNNKDILDLKDKHQQHLSECEDCSQKVQKLNQLRMMLRSLPEEKSPENGWKNIQRAYNTISYKTKMQNLRRSPIK